MRQPVTIGRVALAMAIAAAAATAACKKAAGDAPADEEDHPVAVACEPARLAAASDDVVLRGTVGVPPDRDAVVAPAASGRLLEVKVREGDRVKAGDVLATVDDPTLGPAVRESEAATAAARANLVNADAALARVKRLFDQGIAPRRDVEDAEAKRASAAAEVAAAGARGDLAHHQQSRARVTAPIAGVVVHVLRRAGELVDGTPATPVVEIADPATLEIRADVPANQLVRIREGTAVEIDLDALPGTPLHGAIVFVSPAVDPATSLGTVRAKLEPPAPGADVQLKLGLAGRIVITVARREGVVQVPAVAVRRSTEGGEEIVVCAKKGDDAKAEVRAIKVGARNGDVVEITDGVKVGELVVTQHMVGLEDGATLELGGGNGNASGNGGASGSGSGNANGNANANANGNSNGNASGSGSGSGNGSGSANGNGNASGKAP